MTSGWETKAKIIQWVFQAGGNDGKNSRKGHWSLIVYERQRTGTTLGKFGLVRILDSLEEPTKEFYNKMVLSVLTSLTFYYGKKPKKTKYISKFIRQNPNPKKSKPQKSQLILTKNLMINDGLCSKIQRQSFWLGDPIVVPLHAWKH